MRLSKTIRQAILNAALAKAGIPERKSAIRQRYANWAEAVRVRYVTPEALAAIEAARIASQAVPEILRRQSAAARINGAIEYANVAGARRTVYFCGALKSDDREPRDYVIAPGHGAITLTADDPLTQQLYDIDHDAAALDEHVKHLTASITAVLESVTTDTKLVEIWPEAVAFIPAAERAATSNLPALRVDELNKLIGLP